MKQVSAVCELVNHFGQGTVVVENKQYTIPGLLLGETAIVELQDNFKGKIVKIEKASPSRVKAPCPKYEECGGCQLQHMSYELQLELKTKQVKDALERYHLDSSVLLPTLGMKDPFFYRSKVQMAISEKGPKVMAGFYEENTHKIVNVDRCYIQDDIANNIIRTSRQLMSKHKIKAYQEDKELGLIRHIMVKRSPTTSQVLVVLITQEEKFPGRNNFVTDLRLAHPEITSIVQNVNNRKTSVVLGDFERILYGSGKIEDELLGKRFGISAKTFYQVNHRQTSLLYQKAIELAKPKKEDIVLDAYAGVGTIGILFADIVKKVIAVEINPQSVTNAIQNAKLNHVNNIRFYKDDAISFLSHLADEDAKFDIIVFDPPRSGLETNFIQELTRLKPKKIVYISCEPMTLARDLQVIVDSGYELKRVQPVDMFPQTFHVETITLLSLKTT
jgi:23S rRNA (uracil1939-C5)-methyltransferase